MQRDKDILSGASLEFFNQKPSFWLRNGSMIIFSLLLILALYYSSSEKDKVLSSPLIQEAPIEEVEVIKALEEDIKSIEVFTKLEAQIEKGDTLFALANSVIINNLQDLVRTLENGEISLNQKVKSFRNIRKEDWPFQLEQEVKDIYDALDNKTTKGLSKSTKARIDEMKSEVVNSMKESQSIRESLPKFKTMKDLAEKAFKDGKSQYSKGNIDRSELESLKRKLNETKSFIRIRNNALEDHQRLIYNFNRQIDSAQKKGNKPVLNLTLVESKMKGLGPALNSWLDQVYIISETSGTLVEMISKGPSKSGDLLYRVKSGSSSLNSEPILKANFSNEFDQQVVEGQEIILKVVSDTFEKELLTTIKLKKPIGEDEFQIQVNPPPGLDFDNTFITKGAIIINKPQKRFLSKVWSNFT